MWVRNLLRKSKPYVIIVFVIGFLLFWTTVPDYKLKEPEVKHAFEQSK